MEEKQLEDFLPYKNSSYIKKFNNPNINTKINQEQVIECIRTVIDPEIPVNLYDLGLIYEIKINDKNDIKIKMTLTNPNCPVAGTMPESVGKSVENLQDLNDWPKSQRQFERYLDRKYSGTTLVASSSTDIVSYNDIISRYIISWYTMS